MTTIDYTDRANFIAKISTHGVCGSTHLDAVGGRYVLINDVATQWFADLNELTDELRAEIEAAGVNAYQIAAEELTGLGDDDVPADVLVEAQRHFNEAAPGDDDFDPAVHDTDVCFGW